LRSKNIALPLDVEDIPVMNDITIKVRSVLWIILSMEDSLRNDSLWSLELGLI
jgi:hypothetical protein